MGGEEVEDWDIHPEREAILVGTQDMLLSRALNRGYAASRSRWPIQFGLLHTDCLWVFDEIQLMGAGLATTAQLEAFRRLLGRQDGHGCRSVWMSATMRADWLRTVDFPEADRLPSLELTEEDYRNKKIKRRWKAPKPLAPANARMGGAVDLAAEILKKHQPETRTITVVNTVRRACDLHIKIAKQWGSGDDQRLVLLHSRFRPGDRKKAVERALADPPPPGGTIVVSTQVVEAGVDVSATTLFTELAPWAALVQRFGRCNRKGEDDGAQVFWIDLPTKKEEAEKEAKPYEPDDLKRARDLLVDIRDVSLVSLDRLKVQLPFVHTHVIRRKDLIDLFDTTPDLAGNDIDIDRFVREVEDSDVRLFWRAWDQPKGYEPPPVDEPAPRREELCPALIGSEKNPGFREFAKKHGGKVWRWNFLDEQWERAGADKIAPGQVFLVHVEAGGYSPERGWTGNPDDKATLDAAPTREEGRTLDFNDNDALSRIGVWQTIAEHAGEVCAELDDIVRVLSLTGMEAETLHHAARWHDRGKAHVVFQAALPDGAPDAANVWAKASGQWKRYKRRHFRHELASALAALLSPDDLIPAAQRDLVAYLVAAHHGKVRLSIRSLPDEDHPDGGRRFARGVWDGDELQATELGDGKTAPAVTLSLEPMELGLCEEPPFAGQPSWAERMIRLRDALGPFPLAYLEAILRAADMRASRAAELRAGGCP